MHKPRVAKYPFDKWAKQLRAGKVLRLRHGRDYLGTVVAISGYLRTAVSINRVGSLSVQVDEDGMGITARLKIKKTAK